MPANAVADVLLVTPDVEMAKQILAFLEEHVHKIEWVKDGEKAFNRLDSHFFDVLITELNVGRRINGMRLQSVARERNPDICVVLIAKASEIELATEAMYQGVNDFQTRPLNLGKLYAVIKQGLEHQRLILEQFGLKRQLDEQYGLSNVVGKSRPMVRVYGLLRQAASNNISILLFGEPGTGKDLIAHALHTNSPRKNEAFVKLNCSRISDSMIASELFGYVAGAFTGASQSRQGRLEFADKGTLFLDDIDRLSIPIQQKLTRVLKEGRFERLGSSKTLEVDVRVIASSNRSLEPLVESGSFDEVLWSALSSATIEVPALRDRREDIPLLVEHLLEKSCRERERTIEGISCNAMDLLLRYEWPGNVRELENIVEGMAITCHSGQFLDVNDVPEHIRRSTAPEVGEIRVPTGTSMLDVEQIAIQETMKTCGYNKESCAKTLGIGLRTLYRKLKTYENR